MSIDHSPKTLGSPLAAPKIFLETATSRVARTLFLLNIIGFIIGFSIDLYASLNSFSNNARKLSPKFECSKLNATNPLETGLTQDMGCAQTISITSTFWIGRVSHIANVIAFKLSAFQSNITSSQICTNEFEDQVLNVEATVLYIHIKITSTDC